MMHNNNGIRIIIIIQEVIIQTYPNTNKNTTNNNKC